MSKVTALIAFGVGFIGAGFFYRLFDDVINSYIAPYIRPSIYNTGEAFLWDLIPWMIILLGVFCLIAAGVMGTSSSGGKVSQE